MPRHKAGKAHVARARTLAARDGPRCGKGGHSAEGMLPAEAVGLRVVVFACMRVDMQTLALVCQKGGAGKTTLSIHLAAEAAAHGVQALLLDLDPQASAARWADRRKGGVDIDVAVESPARLEAALRQAEREGYALVVLDTAPHADAAALQAARAATLVLVPARCSILDLDAMGASLDLCTLARRRAAVVLNAAPIRSRVVEEAAETVAKLGGEVTKTIIRERVAFRHALVDGRVAREFEAGGAAAAEITALYIETCKHLNMRTREAV
jgi:chromosome partitioning protein